MPNKAYWACPKNKVLAIHTLNNKFIHYLDYTL